MIITGLLSYIAYGPQFGQAIPGDVGWLKLPTFDWPTDPAWIYRLNQGLHVGLGLILIPVVLAKLWSVIPRLFAFPPARSIAQLLERISLLMLVGGILFEIITGVLNIQYDYIFGFSFYTAHYYGAWVFIAGFVIHITHQDPADVDRVCGRCRCETCCAPTEQTPCPNRPTRTGWSPPNPAPADDEPPGALALVGGGALLHGGDHRGPDARRIHPARGAAASARPDARRRAQRLPGQPDRVGGGDHAGRHRRTVASHPHRRARDGGARPRRLDRDAAAHRPAADRLRRRLVDHRDLVRRTAGRACRGVPVCPNPTSAFVRSVERRGGFNRATLQANQVIHPDSLLALRVNDADLSPDHGYPARIIVPGLPGVHNTKWVASIDFRTG